MVLTIGNTHLGVLQWCLRTIGKGTLVQAKNTPRNPRNLPYHRYNLDCKEDLAVLLPQLLPYLRIKKDQAEAATKFLRVRAQNRRGGPFTEAQIDCLFELRLSNQKSYNKGSQEHIRYKGQTFTRAQFREFLLNGRDGSIYRSVVWTPEMDALVASDTDVKVAAQLGLKLGQVRSRRVALGRSSPHFVSLDEAQRIRLLRLQGLTQGEIAAEMGLGRSSVCRILKGAR